MTKTIYPQPPGQEQQSTDPRLYQIRIIVAGTRGYNDRKEFHDVMCSYIERFDSEPILFISGAARTGADRLIIDWCKKFGYPCLEMPADWDKHGKGAGFKRNAEMGEVASHLLAFYDGVSRGTADMIEIAEERDLKHKIIYYSAPAPEPKKEPVYEPAY